VVVVGCGAAGLSAAITAHDAGATVVVLEKTPEAEAGGSTRVSGNVWFSPHDPATAGRYLRNLSRGYDLPDSLVEAWAAEVAKNTDFVVGLGGAVGPMGYPAEFPEIPGHECDEMYRIDPGYGHGRLWLTLFRAADARGLDIRYETPAKELVQDETGAVVGVVAGPADELFTARRGVVLASGGFANNPEMARDYLRLPGSTPWGSPASTGDGIRMAQRIGADLWHMSNFFARPGLKAPELRSGFHIEFPCAHGWIYVGDDGRRLFDESVPSRHGRVMRHGRLELHPAVLFHAVFDEETRLAGPIRHRFEDNPFGFSSSIEGYQWSEDNTAEIEQGWIAEAPTLRGLAGALGVDPDGLEACVEEYNRFCDDGVDPAFGRDPATLVPLRRPPYYGWTWPPLVVYTCGGPRKDERARVLHVDARPIPGLYAAGETSSTYSWGMSGGMMIGDALAFGRIAGREAAARRPGSL
jgi:succinate dehydrogenase/fumarate reductase flavoprotein subunit